MRLHPSTPFVPTLRTSGQGTKRQRERLVEGCKITPKATLDNPVARKQAPTIATLVQESACGCR